MQDKIDFLYYPSVIMMTSKSPMKKYDISLVTTKNYLFFFPKQSESHFGLVSFYKNHDIVKNTNGVLDGVETVDQGIENIIKASESTEQLEKLCSEVLGGSDKFIYTIQDASSFKIKSFLGKTTARISRSRMNWASCMPNGKAEGKEFRAFHNQ